MHADFILCMCLCRCKYHILLFLLCAILLPNTISAETYYVLPANSSQPCPGQHCRTLPEYAEEAEVGDFPSNATLIFLGGEHILSRNFDIKDINRFSLSVANKSEAVISCLNGDSFVIMNVREVSISGLVLVGCYGNTVKNASKFDVKDSRFQGSREGNQTALSTSDIESINIINCSFTSYKVKAYDSLLGCALLFLNLTSVNIANSEFLSSSAEFMIKSHLSSAICAFKSELMILDSSFKNNAARTGGVIYAEDSTNVTAVGSTFANNSAVFGADKNYPFGGVGYITRGSHFAAHNCTFSDNLSEVEGGVLYVEIGSTVQTVDCLFLNNTASLDIDSSGGAVMGVKQQSAADIHGSSFIGNAACKGGAITAYGASVMNITDCLFESNEARSNFVEGRGSSYGGAFNTDENVTVHLADCTFMNNYAYTSGGALYIRSTCLHISGRNAFVNNRAVYYGGAFTVMNGSTLYINDYHHTCEEGQYLAEFSNNSAEHGGALNIIQNSVALIQCSSFAYNTAQRNTSDSCRAGAILARTNTTINLTNTYFYGNMANGKGGVLFAQSAEVFSSGWLTVDHNAGDKGVIYLSSCNASLEGNTTFYDNENSFLAHGSNVVFKGNTEFSGGKRQGLDGGAITASRSSIEIWGSFLLRSNIAKNGGGMFAGDSTINSYGFCTFFNNSAANGGGLYAYNSKVHFKGNTTHEANQATGNGGAIFALGSDIEYSSVYGSLSGNTAAYGGAIYIDRTSSLYIIKEEMECNKSDGDYDRWYCVTPDEWLKLNFSNNWASEKGGALYVNDTDASSCGINVPFDPDFDPIYGECFIQGIAIYESADDWDTADANFKNIYFSNNSATQDGSVLYGGLLDRCAISTYAEQRQILGGQFAPDPLTYVSRMSDFSNSELSSDPMRICFCEDGTDVFDCSLSAPEIEVLSGKTFNLSVVVVNQVNKSVASEVRAYLSSTSVKLGKNQGILKVVNDSCTVLSYSIFSDSNETLSLHPYGGPCVDRGISKTEISIHLDSSCPVGFAMSSSNFECECDPSIREFVNNCSIDSESVIREGDFWISGEFDKNSNHSVGFVIHNHCPYDYCRPATEKVEVNLNSKFGSDAQCAFNRNGRLCGGCKDNYSLTLGSSKCKKCSNYWLLLIIPFGLAGICLVAFMMMCNLTLAAGTLSGPLFYANILIANRATFFPYQKQDVLTVLVSWLGLNLGISTCFYNGMDSFGKMWVQISFEVYLIILVLLVIVLGRGAKVSAFFHKYNLNPVNTLATLVMLSYEKLSRKIYSLLAYTYMNYSNGTDRVWLFDPNVKYLRNEHIPMAVVAVLILVTGIIFNVLLLFNKQIVAKSRSVYFNKFLEAFYVPLKSNHQYWVGLLLLIRSISYFTSEFLSAGKNPNHSLSFVFALVVGIVGLKLVYIYSATFKFNRKQNNEPLLPPLRDEDDDGGKVPDSGEGEHYGIVYKNYAIDLLESSFILNIIVLTFFTLYIGGDEEKQSILFYALSSVALLSFIGILIYHACTYTVISAWLKKKCTSQNEVQEDTMPSEDYGSFARIQPNPSRSEIITV